MSQQQYIPDRRKNLSDLPVLPEGIPVLLLGSIYSMEEKVCYLKFYDPESGQVFFHRDRTGHQPYCYTKMQYEDEAVEATKGDFRYNLVKVRKFDIIADREIEVIKVEAADPLAIGGSQNNIRDKIPCWESDIKYHENYLFDNALIVGTWYKRKGNIIETHTFPLSEALEQALQTRLWDKLKDDPATKEKQYRDYTEQWALLLNQPVPQFKRIAIDIEVQVDQMGRMPMPRDHNNKITAIGMYASDGFKKVFVLQDAAKSDDTAFISEADICMTEREMIQKAIAVIKDYPVIISFNGDDFDLPYLYMRAQDPRIDPVDKQPLAREELPIIVRNETFEKRNNLFPDPVEIRHGIHLDIYRFFSNKSIQNYAFSKKYSGYKLDEIALALINEGKEDYDGELSDLPMQKLASYCFNDARITFELTNFNNSLLMQLMVACCRIARLGIDYVCRQGVNQWLRGITYYEHRQRNELIPIRDELKLKGGASTMAVIKDKKYRGADVLDPIAGIHFNVIVVDFASLYPSIIKVHNLSYETINCPHEACKQDPDQQIPETTHWTCKRKRGITSLLIGSLRDLRVNYYKYLAKDKTLPAQDRELYNVISQALKVIMNASYGVIGFEQFPLYCLPVADSVTAYGRTKINLTLLKCKEVNIVVIAGDTDSLFLKNPSKEWVDKIVEWAHSELEVDLEVDKTYRYVVFSALKKNYVGVLADGSMDIKGLTGKKSHTPPFIKKAFTQITDILKGINVEADFGSAKVKIKEIVMTNTKNLEDKKIPLDEMIFNVAINKNPSKYGRKSEITEMANTIDGKTIDVNRFKAVPQHIKAALMLMDSGREVKVGDKIAYIKTRDEYGVKPLLLAQRQDVDTEKYMETMESVLDQLTSPLGLHFESLQGKPRATSMDEFWSN